MSGQFLYDLSGVCDNMNIAHPLYPGCYVRCYIFLAHFKQTNLPLWYIIDTSNKKRRNNSMFFSILITAMLLITHE